MEGKSIRREVREAVFRRVFSVRIIMSLNHSVRESRYCGKTWRKEEEVKHSGFKMG